MSTIKVTSEVMQQIETYNKFMLAREYTVLTAHGYSTYLSRFLRWTPRNNGCILQESISGFLDEELICNPRTYKYCRAALYLYFMMVENRKFPKRKPKERNHEIEVILKQFYDYSVTIKRIKPDSATWELSCVRSFLEYITDIMPFCSENITAHDIRKFVIDRLSHIADSSKGRSITAIRNFFRFQKFEKKPIHESIFRLPLSPAVWKNASFPTTIDEEIFNCLHEIPDDSTPTGKRDCCIILCFTELALRCIEVASLELDDFNWREGSVIIKNTKNSSDRKLPISEKLGRAIIEYLKLVRPKTSNRILFVRFKRTCGEPMGCSQIRGVVRRVYLKTGTDIKSTGTHILRRTAATKIYNAGNSLKMTADILGHECLDSTVRYTKADINSLYEVASPWPEKAGKVGVHYAK